MSLCGVGGRSGAFRGLSGRSAVPPPGGHTDVGIVAQQEPRQQPKHPRSGAGAVAVPDDDDEGGDEEEQAAHHAADEVRPSPVHQSHAVVQPGDAEDDGDAGEDELTHSQPHIAGGPRRPIAQQGHRAQRDLPQQHQPLPGPQEGTAAPRAPPVPAWGWQPPPCSSTGIFTF